MGIFCKIKPDKYEINYKNGEYLFSYQEDQYKVDETLLKNFFGCSENELEEIKSLGAKSIKVSLDANKEDRVVYQEGDELVIFSAKDLNEKKLKMEDLTFNEASKRKIVKLPEELKDLIIYSDDYNDLVQMNNQALQNFYDENLERYCFKEDYSIVIKNGYDKFDKIEPATIEKPFIVFDPTKREPYAISEETLKNKYGDLYLPKCGNEWEIGIEPKEVEKCFEVPERMNITINIDGHKFSMKEGDVVIGKEKNINKLIDKYAEDKVLNMEEFEDLDFIKKEKLDILHIGTDKELMKDALHEYNNERNHLKNEMTERVHIKKNKFPF